MSLDGLPKFSDFHSTVSQRRERGESYKSDPKEPLVTDTKQAAKPRTQPSQTELRIPDDLKKRYEYCMDTKGLYDFSNGSVAELIERIARLEGGG